MEKTLSDFRTLTEFAAQHSVTRRTALNWVKSGRVDAQRVGSQWLVDTQSTPGPRPDARAK